MSHAAAVGTDPSHCHRHLNLGIANLGREEGVIKGS